MIGAESSVWFNAVLRGDIAAIRVGRRTNIQVGRDSIIAVGSVVTEGTIVPPGSLVMGLPGKVKRSLAPDEIEHNRQSAEHYVANAKRFAAANV